MPFYRIGHWRWVRWPADFNVKLSRAYDEFYLGWLDPELKKEVLDARRAGRTYPATIEVHDQYRAK
jgi:microcin C transport system substrate-binding protein